MNEVTSDKLKQSSIGETIIKAIQIQFYIPPLLFGLGIELGHKFGSKWLKHELFKPGFCMSPSETTRFKQSVIGNNDSNVKAVLSGLFTQWAADNADHNI